MMTVCFALVRTWSLTKVTVISRVVDKTHGDVPARSSAEACVA